MKVSVNEKRENLVQSLGRAEREENKTYISIAGVENFLPPCFAEKYWLYLTVVKIRYAGNTVHVRYYAAGGLDI